MKKILLLIASIACGVAAEYVQTSPTGAAPWTPKRRVDSARVATIADSALRAPASTYADTSRVSGLADSARHAPPSAYADSSRVSGLADSAKRAGWAPLDTVEVRNFIWKGISTAHLRLPLVGNGAFLKMANDGSDSVVASHFLMYDDSLLEYQYVGNTHLIPSHFRAVYNIGDASYGYAVAYGWPDGISFGKGYGIGSSPFDTLFRIPDNGPTWSKSGYRVLSGTAKGFLKADGSVDSSGVFAGVTDSARASHISDTAKKSGNAATATKLSTARTIATSGDVTGAPTAFDGTANVTIPTTLSTLLTAGSAGSATAVPTLTWDAKGRLTAAGSAAISIPHTQISDWGSYVSTTAIGALPYAGVSGSVDFNNIASKAAGAYPIFGTTSYSNAPPGLAAAGGGGMLWQGFGANNLDWNAQIFVDAQQDVLWYRTEGSPAAWRRWQQLLTSTSSIPHTQISDWGTYINQALLTTSSPTFGPASLGAWSNNSTIAWFGASGQNNTTNGNSGFLQSSTGDKSVYMCAPANGYANITYNSQAYLTIGAPGVSMPDASGLTVSGLITANGGISGNLAGHASLDIPLTGSSAITGSFAPAANQYYDFGAPSYQWNNVRAKTFVENGTSLSGLYASLNNDNTLVGQNDFAGSTITDGNLLVRGTFSTGFSVWSTNTARTLDIANTNVNIYTVVTNTQQTLPNGLYNGQVIFFKNNTQSSITLDARLGTGSGPLEPLSTVMLVWDANSTRWF